MNVVKEIPVEEVTFQQRPEIMIEFAHMSEILCPFFVVSLCFLQSPCPSFH